MVMLTQLRPEHNTPLVLTLDYLFGFIPTSVACSIALGRPVGIYARYVRYVAMLCVLAGAVMLPIVVVTIGREPGQWPKGLAVCAGAIAALAWVGRLAYRRRGQPQSTNVLRRYAKPFDYLIGLFYYGIFTYALAETAKQAPTGDLLIAATAMVGLFVTSQLTITLLFRIINASLEHDYEASFNQHYAMAAIPVAGAVVIDLAYGVSPSGAAFRLLLLALAWRYTAQGPTALLKTLRLLRERFQPQPAAQR